MTGLGELLEVAAARTPDAPALRDGREDLTFAQWRDRARAAGAALRARGLEPGERVAVHAESSVDAVVACFGAAMAGLLFVPLNPGLRSVQRQHVLHDSGARAVVGPPEWAALVVRDEALAGAFAVPWAGLGEPVQAGRDADVTTATPAALLYTSGSTGRAKGVVVSHGNFVAGALSVAGYLGLQASDRILAALPLSFDAGFSQLTTACAAGATAVLHEYRLPHDCLRVVARERITVVTAVPPLWMQLCERAWPEDAAQSLRLLANTGGRWPWRTMMALRARAPGARLVPMYGLTEAFRSTWLPPEQVEARPDSIGRAIPGATIHVVRDDGSECAPGEAGELVHRGPTVTLGYWNDPERTARRFRPWPPGTAAPALRQPVPLAADVASPAVEWAVWSGDVVRRDDEGFLYFVGRRDEQIKTSGYRVSPTEVEEALYRTGSVAECVVFGVPDERLGEAIAACLRWRDDSGGLADEPGEALGELRARLAGELPTWMIPSRLAVHSDPLPRTPNGKLDRVALREGWGASPDVAEPPARSMRLRDRPA